MAKIGAKPSGEEIVPLVGCDVAEGGLAERHQRNFRLGDARVGVGLAGEGLQGRLVAVELAEGRDGVENLLGEENPSVAVDKSGTRGRIGGKRGFFVKKTSFLSKKPI